MYFSGCNSIAICLKYLLDKIELCFVLEARLTLHPFIDTYPALGSSFRTCSASSNSLTLASHTLASSNCPSKVRISSNTRMRSPAAGPPPGVVGLLDASGCDEAAVSAVASEAGTGGQVAIGVNVHRPVPSPIKVSKCVWYFVREGLGTSGQSYGQKRQVQR